MKAVVTVAVAAALLSVPLGVAFGQQYQQPQQPPQQGPPPAGSAGGAGGGQTGLTVASDSLLGSKVRDAQGKDVGQVSKLLIDPQRGNVTSVIIKRGGMLGMGGEEIGVPWEALKLQRGENQQLIVTMEQPMLEQAPRTQQQQRRQEGQTPAASPPTSGQQQQPGKQQ